MGEKYAIDYTPQVLAWWVGAIWAFPQKIYYENMNDINNEVATKFKDYFKHFSMLRYGNEELYMEISRKQLLEALQEESKIIINPNTHN